MKNWINQCHFGDVRDVLRRMITDGVKVNTIVTSPPYWGLRSYLPADHPDKSREIGSEPTLKEFLATMVEVFDLCREVLHDDGTMWVNMGDSYLPNKQLGGQPHRLAFALQDAGWWLRQDIVWHKPNPMPESTRDRCTKAHEYLFLLAKNERYYYDFDSVREPVSGTANPRRATIKSPDGWNTGPGGHGSFHPEGREQGKTHLAGNVNPPKGQLAYEAGDEKQRTKAGLLAYAERTRAAAAVGRRIAPIQVATKVAEAGHGIKNNDSMDAALAEVRDDRNRRSVWTVPSEPYKGAHFATFPTKLIEHCILAGAPAGGVVLDIFMGSGTTAQVSEQLGRKWIGIEIDVRNKTLQLERLRQPSFEFADSA